MQELAPPERFEELLSFLKETHSIRPTFLNELQQVGFGDELFRRILFY